MTRKNYKIFLLLILSLIYLPPINSAQALSQDQKLDLDVLSKKKTRIQIDESAYKILNSDVIDLGLMKANGLEPLDYRQFNSGQEVIEKLIRDYNLNTNQVKLAFYDYQTDEEYFLNEEDQVIVASVSKVPMVGIYTDLVEEGKVNWSDKIPYNPTYYTQGAGKVTNNPKKDSYTISELAYEAIVNSDNTASYLLAYNYIEKYGDIRKALLDFAEDYKIDKESYFSDNYGTSYTTLQIWKKIADDDKYTDLVKLMQEEKTDQLFISYLKKDVANKYGRLDQMVNDAGIFYSPDGTPQFILVVFCDNLTQADPFLEELALRLYEWHSQTNQY